MTIFALDSSTASASVAIIKNEKTLFASTLDYGTTHSERLMPLCDTAFKTTCLKPSDIDLFAVCNGPGSYTGLRIGVSVIKGLAMATNRPCVAVSTLSTLAFAQQGNVIPLINARRGNYFCGGYTIEGDDMTEVISQRHAPSEEILGFFDEGQTLLVGDGALMFFESLTTAQQEKFRLCDDLPLGNMPRADVAANLALKTFAKSGAVSAAELLPCYIRPVHIG